MADSLSLGFGVTAGSIGAVLVVCALLAYFTQVSHVLPFWAAFILTRPFGASFGDLLTKPKSAGGLDLGTLKASLVILSLFVVFFAWEIYTKMKKEGATAEVVQELRKVVKKEETKESGDIEQDTP